MALERRPDGIVDEHGHFYPWSYFDVIPAAHVKGLIEQDRAAVKKQAEKRARQADEAARRRAPTETYPLEWPRWMFVEGRYSWHEWNPVTRRYDDTGILPTEPGKPIALQRPPGR
jgi:hypothetical protein